MLRTTQFQPEPVSNRLAMMRLVSQLCLLTLATFSAGLSLPEQVGFGPGVPSDLSGAYHAPTIKVPVQLAVMSKVHQYAYTLPTDVYGLLTELARLMELGLVQCPDG